MSDPTFPEESPNFASFAQVLSAEEFPDVDLALRRGQHIDRGDSQAYSFLQDAQEHLEAFYRRFGCDLIHRSDGYFFLLPTGDKLPRKHLSENSMLVGQALALLYLDPNTVQVGGVTDSAQLLAQLDSVVGTDVLIRSFNPKRRRYDERVAQENVRKKVAVEVRRLAGLGFVELVDGNIRLRPALLRFAEPVRGLAQPAESLAKLVASGDITMTGDQSAPDEDLDESEEDSAESTSLSEEEEENETTSVLKEDGGE